MTNLSSPTASSATGLPNVMSDIIDSLKRLERVGSDNSKTTQKLLDAAGDLSQKIVGYLEGYPDGKILAKPAEEFKEVRPGLSLPRWKSFTHDYAVVDGALTMSWDYGERRYVASDRDTALAFSKDVASGLLDAIAATLEVHKQESADALQTILNAKTDKQN